MKGRSSISVESCDSRAASTSQGCSLHLYSGWFCRTLHLKSCFFSWNVKTQTKQFRVSILVTVYPLQVGFDGGGMENSIKTTPALPIITSVLAPMKDQSAYVGLHSSHLLLFCLWGWAPSGGSHSDTPQTLLIRLPKKGWAREYLHQMEMFSHWRELPAGRRMGQCPSSLQCSHRGGGGAGFVVKNGHDSRRQLELSTWECRQPPCMPALGSPASSPPALTSRSPCYSSSTGQLRAAALSLVQENGLFWRQGN